MRRGLASRLHLLLTATLTESSGIRVRLSGCCLSARFFPLRGKMQLNILRREISAAALDLKLLARCRLVCEELYWAQKSK